MLKRIAVMLSLLALLLATSMTDAATDQADGLYVKKGSWPETMLAARARLLASPVETPAIQLGPWHSTGALPAKSFGEALFPEKGVNLEAKGADKKALWSVQTSYRDGAVQNLPSDGGRGSTYLYRTITLTTAAKVAAGFGSDDGMEAWLNGKKIISHDTPRGPDPDQEKATLDLKAGENQLLLKIHNNSGGHGFYFKLKDGVSGPAEQLWQRVEQDFPNISALMKEDAQGRQLAWFRSAADTTFEEKLVAAGIKKMERRARKGAQGDLQALQAAKASPNDPRWLKLYETAAGKRSTLVDGGVGSVNFDALEMAVADLTKTFPRKYAKGADYLKQLQTYKPRMKAILDGVARKDEQAEEELENLLALQREALLANPLLDFDTLLLVKRDAKGPKLGMPQNWQGNCALPRGGYDDEIAALALGRPGDPRRAVGELKTLLRPDTPKFVGDVDLHFDGDRMLFSMLGTHNRWQIWEVKTDGTGLRQVTPGEHADVDNYDACYLPDGRIIFASTRCFQGVPCVGGADTVANLCILDPKDKSIRQLCFDQDHNWCPTVLNNGRVLYSRWEYSDTPHYFSRLMFSMNPDGTGQGEYYGSNSYWPNSMFYARPIPDHPTQVVAIVSGHHGVARMGELIIFDPAKGRFEADGVVQRIPGYGEKVEPKIVDGLVDGSWPKFLHPYPLSDKHFLVASQPTSRSNWGVYLVDIFDNMLLLKDMPGNALLEPLPLRRTTPPPAVPDKVRLDRNDALVYLTDVHAGPGLKGVPRGTAKKLRVYEFHYGYPKMGGHKNVGVEGAWDVHRILGTVPLEEDGSAIFRVPANTPLAVQPLDAEGRALQVMRSWFVAMPGEILSCVGCHDKQNETPAPRGTLAAKKPAQEITPWHGPTRGFSFKRELQPVLDQYCVGCHDGQPTKDGQKVPNFARQERNGWGNFTPAYLELHPFLRRPGPESDYHMQPPLEFHANTSELVQMLKKGHHNVQLDAEAWDRLYTWIDLNVPDHGSWGAHSKIQADFHQRRMEMRQKYALRPEDPEDTPDGYPAAVEFEKPKPAPQRLVEQVSAPSWPFDAAEAARRQQAAGAQTKRTVDLGDGVALELALIPAGEFVMGAPDGALDEAPLARAKVDKPFWMGTLEISNAQYRRFDPNHHSGYINQNHKDHTTPGYPVHSDNFPAIRLTWKQAMAYCQWLSDRTGQKFSLPTEAQWEWACRAGSDRPFNYGDLDADFSAHANLADASTKLLAVSGVNPQPIRNPSKYEDFLPKDTRFDDGQKIVAEVGQYAANAWGLKDMHGNVAEWTRTSYQPYPYRMDDGRNAPAADGEKVARGGSWRDRPKRATASNRQAYHAWQPVFNVGIRVVCEAGVKVADADAKPVKVAQNR